MGGRGSSYAILKHMQIEDDHFFSGEEDFINDFESDYHNEMFNKLKELNISVRQSTDDIDDKIFERQEKAVFEVAKKYNYILSETTQIQDIQLAGKDLGRNGGLGYCQPGIIDGQIIQRVVVNKAYLDDYDLQMEEVSKAIEKNHFVKTNKKFKGRDYVLTHEMGHAVQNSIFEKIRTNHNLNLSLNNLIDYRKLMGARIKNEVIKIWKNKYTTGEKDDNINLSLYSRKNEREWFAETFTNLQLADNPAPISLALDEYLREKKYENI